MGVNQHNPHLFTAITGVVLPHKASARGTRWSAQTLSALALCVDAALDAKRVIWGNPRDQTKMTGA